MLGLNAYIIMQFILTIKSTITNLNNRIKTFTYVSPSLSGRSNSALIWVVYNNQSQVQQPKFIKELNMTEPIFEILSYNKQQYTPPKQPNLYHSLQQHFCITSYGLYTQIFIGNIVQEALGGPSERFEEPDQLQEKYQSKFGQNQRQGNNRQTPIQNSRERLCRLPLKKLLRKCIKKFMLSDLQLLFVGYYCSANGWDIDNRHILSAESECVDPNDDNWLGYQKSDQKEGETRRDVVRLAQLYLDLNAYFVKSYIGNRDQFESIESQMLDRYPKFGHIYEKWVLQLSKQAFLVTPRQINHLYSRYTRCCQIEPRRKDYNELVDTIIDLSTSYSIIPNRGGAKRDTQHHSKHKQSIGLGCGRAPQQQYGQEQEEPDKQQQHGEKHNLKYRRSSRSHSKMEKILQHSSEHEKWQQQQIYEGSGLSILPYNNNHFNIGNQSFYDLPQNSKRKSSLLQDSLQQLGRRSQLLQVDHECKGTMNQQQQHIQTQRGSKGQKQRQIHKERADDKQSQHSQRGTEGAQKLREGQGAAERSRDKKHNKISLSFKRKQKPNQTVLGYMNEPGSSMNNSSFAVNANLSSYAHANGTIESKDKEPAYSDQRNNGSRRSSRDWSRDKLQYSGANNWNNQSVRENLSYINLNLRSNRSSRSNSQLPFPWKPTDNFFDKSKLN